MWYKVTIGKYNGFRHLIEHTCTVTKGLRESHSLRHSHLPSLTQERLTVGEQ
jgi:hypothetical protein